MSCIGITVVALYIEDWWTVVGGKEISNARIHSMLVEFLVSLSLNFQSENPFVMERRRRILFVLLLLLL